MPTLIPKSFHYLLKNCKTLKEALDALMTRATSEDLYIVQIIARMAVIQKSRCLAHDKTIMTSYMKDTRLPLEINNAYHMNASVINQYFSKLYRSYIVGCTADVLDDIKEEFNDPNRYENYTHTFLTILEDTLNLLERDISTEKLNNIINSKHR